MPADGDEDEIYEEQAYGPEEMPVARRTNTGLKDRLLGRVSGRPVPSDTRDPLVFARRMEKTLENELTHALGELTKAERLLVTRQDQVARTKAELQLVRDRITAMQGRVKGRQLSALKRPKLLKETMDSEEEEPFVEGLMPAPPMPAPAARPAPPVRQAARAPAQVRVDQFIHEARRFAEEHTRPREDHMPLPDPP